MTSPTGVPSRPCVLPDRPSAPPACPAPRPRRPSTALARDPPQARRAAEEPFAPESPDLGVAQPPLVAYAEVVVQLARGEDEPLAARLDVGLRDVAGERADHLGAGHRGEA